MGANSVYTGLAVLSIATASSEWLLKDEVFHVGQAQSYCAGRFKQWDPKITTPPGVYLLSYIAYLFSGKCDPFMLRALNCVAICAITHVSSAILEKKRYITGIFPTKGSESSGSNHEYRLAHTAFNIAFFPPLFFFAGLYYTDVTSTLCVLVAHYCFLNSLKTTVPQNKSAIMAALFGIVSLCFRQTNIFWVAVFPAGLAVLHTLKDSQRPPRSQKLASNPNVADVVSLAWKESLLYDCTVQDAYFGDYFKVIISMVTVAVQNIPKILQALIPYTAVLAIFGSFVAWNGGVVLGDKSNHVATIHTPQMLYIWPYILFFTFPHIFPQMLLQLIQSGSKLRREGFGHLPNIALSIGWFSVSAAVAVAAVHYNTIIHSFTLADNRHYVFYVFRIILRHPAIKYLAAPVYCIAAWGVLTSLGAYNLDDKPESDASSTQDINQVKLDTTVDTTGANDRSTDSPTVGFTIIWLITSALSVITAPLVEPRYFIIPWVIWRIYVPSGLEKELSTKATTPSHSLVQTLYPGYSARLWLESLWFLVVNYGTAYMFLNKGFTWPQEPGKVQRFMW